MALTRDIGLTVAARARCDPQFPHALLTEVLNACLAGDPQMGKAMLRDLVNATVGFEGLAAEVKKPSKSLHRMLAPHGNPSAENFFGIVKALQKKTRVRLRVMAELRQGGRTRSAGTEERRPGACGVPLCAAATGTPMPGDALIGNPPRAGAAPRGCSPFCRTRFRTTPRIRPSRTER